MRIDSQFSSCAFAQQSMRRPYLPKPVSLTAKVVRVAGMALALLMQGANADLETLSTGPSSDPHTPSSGSKIVGPILGVLLAACIIVVGVYSYRRHYAPIVGNQGVPQDAHAPRPAQSRRPPQNQPVPPEDPSQV